MFMSLAIGLVLVLLILHATDSSADLRNIVPPKIPPPPAVTQPREVEYINTVDDFYI